MSQKKSKPKVKLSFSRVSVLLMYVNIIGMFAYVMITKDYPPTSFVIAWFGFWAVQAVVTCKLQLDKRKHNSNISFWDAMLPYLNQENIAALAEKFLDIDLTYKKAKSIKQLEEECNE